MRDLKKEVKVPATSSRLIIHLYDSTDYFVIYSEGTGFKKVRCNKEGNVIAGPFPYHSLTPSSMTEQQKNKIARILFEKHRRFKLNRSR